MIETRFADPVTAIDLSLKNVCIGSAMGRISFYDIPNEKNIVSSEYEAELVRGISHSANGDLVYIAVGDQHCQSHNP